MKTTLWTLVVAALFATTSVASGQVIAYRHRSTVLGDQLSGAAELVRASGLAARDRAAAYATWVQAETAREDLRQKQWQAYYYEQEYRRDLLRAKAEENRRQTDEQAAAEEASAKELLRRYQLGALTWPAALQRPEFARSRQLIESILDQWNSAADASTSAHRRALVTEAGVLRVRLSDPDSEIPFADRVAAVRTLKTLHTLALQGDGGSPSSSAQLAAR